MSKKRTIHESSEEEEIECATDKDSESEMSYGYGMEVPDSAIEWTQPGTDPEGFPFPPRKPSSLARNERGKAHICKNCHFYLKEPRLKKLNPSSGKLEHVCPFKCTDYRTCYTRRVALHPEMDEEYNRLFSSYKQQCKELKETKSKTAVTSKAASLTAQAKLKKAERDLILKRHGQSSNDKSPVMADTFAANLGRIPVLGEASAVVTSFSQAAAQFTQSSPLVPYRPATTESSPEPRATAAPCPPADPQPSPLPAVAAPSASASDGRSSGGLTIDLTDALDDDDKLDEQLQNIKAAREAARHITAHCNLTVVRMVVSLLGSYINKHK